MNEPPLIRRIAPISRKSAFARIVLTSGVCASTVIALIGAELGMSVLALSGTLGNLCINILWIWEDLG